MRPSRLLLLLPLMVSLSSAFQRAFVSASSRGSSAPRLFAAAASTLAPADVRPKCEFVWTGPG